MLAATLTVAGCNDSPPPGPIGMAVLEGEIVDEIEGKKFPTAKRSRDHPSWVISHWRQLKSLIQVSSRGRWSFRCSMVMWRGSGRSLQRSSKDLHFNRNALKLSKSFSRLMRFPLCRTLMSDTMLKLST